MSDYFYCPATEMDCGRIFGYGQCSTCRLSEAMSEEGHLVKDDRQPRPITEALAAIVRREGRLVSPENDPFARQPKMHELKDEDVAKLWLSAEAMMNDPLVMEPPKPSDQIGCFTLEYGLRVCRECNNACLNPARIAIVKSEAEDPSVRSLLQRMKDLLDKQ